MIVDTTAGKVEGIRRDDIFQFRGVPYAWADRFCPPEPPLPWAGVRDAGRFGPAAPQNPSPTDLLLGLPEQELSEDCLVLNIFTPAADEGRRPVLVWIHGGGFTSGSGHVPTYNGTNLVRRGDVVVVTLNYRLGALGFLHLDELLPDYAGSALNGIRDQIAALRWVRDNIANFGGDPGRVTLFGESAGGGSVAALLSSPQATGLFQGAIVQSGTADHLLTPEAAAVVAERMLTQLEVPPTKAARLLDLEADAFVAAQTAVEGALLAQSPNPVWGGPKYLQLPFQPVVGGDVLPVAPIEGVRAGRAAGIPLVVGTTRDEWNLFMLSEAGSGQLTDERLERRSRRLLGDEADPSRAAEMIALYQDSYPGVSNRALWCAMVTDRMFRMPAIGLAEAQLPHAPGQVAMYRFDYPSAAFGGLPGACHAIDIPFVFDNVGLQGIDLLLGGVDDGTRLLARRCADAWLAMARRGAPAHDDLIWPAYEEARRSTCILDRTPTVIDDPHGEVRAFWAG